MNLFKLKTNNYFLILSIVASIVVSIVFYILINFDNNEKLIAKLENSLVLTKNLLEDEKRYALSLSILLSEDKELLEAYTNNQREKTFNIVNQKINTLKKLQDSSFEVQIHTKDLNTYLRSWDYNITDIPLSSFRHGLVKVKEELKPLVSIELGKRLNIKAISPLMKNGQFIGSIEVIIGFDHLTTELEQRGYDIGILLDSKYLNIATTLQENPRIQGYTLVNHKTKNKDHSQLIRTDELKDYGYFTNEKLAFSYLTYYSLKREKLGYIIVSVKNGYDLTLKRNYEKRITPTNNKVIIE